MPSTLVRPSILAANLDAEVYTPSVVSPSCCSCASHPLIRSAAVRSPSARVSAFWNCLLPALSKANWSTLVFASEKTEPTVCTPCAISSVVILAVFPISLYLSISAPALSITSSYPSTTSYACTPEIIAFAESLADISPTFDKTVDFSANLSL